MDAPFEERATFENALDGAISGAKALNWFTVLKKILEEK